MSYAVDHNSRAAASRFNIEPKHVREWRSVAKKFNTVKVNRKWLDGGGRNCIDAELEEEVHVGFIVCIRKCFTSLGRWLCVKQRKFLMIKPLTQPVEMLLLQAEGGVKNLWGIMDSRHCKKQQLYRKILHI